MTGVTTGAVRDLIDRALEVYRDDPAALAVLDACYARVSDPLRVAMVGMVKAGKSTLLNAILGEEIAATDAGECTRIVTWYRYGDTPRVVIRRPDGESKELPVVRVKGRLTFDLGEETAEDVGRLEVEWPSSTLKDITLIDTPGVASLSAAVSERSLGFLLPEGAPSETDAVIYLMRHLRDADVSLLQSLREGAAGLAGATNSVVVLSRADEAGSGRIDAMLSASAIAERFRHDESLAELVSAVVPVAGLLAQSARSLRQSDFTALAKLAALDRAQREKLLVSADRFVADSARPGSKDAARAALLERFGPFGIRLACSLIKGGVSDASSLSRELARRSGLDELLELVAGRFQARAAFLKADAALASVERVMKDHPHEGTDELEASIERLRATAHELRELTCLATLRTSPPVVEPALVDEAERLLGGKGVSDADRLGLGPDAPASDIEAAARAALRTWRGLAGSPAADRATVALCQAVVRSCEAVLAASGHGADTAPRLVLAPEPGRRGWQEPGNERRAS